MQEIDATHYCDSSGLIDGGRVCKNDFAQCASYCQHYHCKWPTPEQFKAEYDRDWPDDGAVYCGYTIGDSEVVHWLSPSYFREAKRIMEHNLHIKCFVYCACNPFGRPPEDWRPE
jgi:hypothetical protein